MRTLDGLAAPGGRRRGDGQPWRSPSRTHWSTQAEAIRTIPGETRPEGPVRVGDGVLDDFLAEADGLR